jgi:hypothetical protein
MKRMIAAATLLGALAGCAAAQGVPSEVQMVAGAPSMICSGILAQEAQSLQQLKAVLDQTP